MPPADQTSVPFTEAEWQACLKVLRALNDRPEAAPARAEVEALAARLNKQARKARRKESDRELRRADREIIESTERCRADPDDTGQARLSPPAPDTGELPSGEPAGDSREVRRARRCHLCGTSYRQVHFFHHRLCPGCAAFNYERRLRRGDLRGRRALITGGRIKIGFQTALKLLRDGADVIVTTRFPQDAARRYAAEPDFPAWRERLRIHCLDLRDVRAATAFSRALLDAPGHLDILINNAAQTVRRPAALEEHLRAGEAVALDEAWGNLLEARPGDVPVFAPEMPVAPPALLDLRPVNSWTLLPEQIDPPEMLEVLLINAAAPLLLTSHLKTLLERSPFPDRYIVQVSAVEGQFGRTYKAPGHVHTNMAKAALNMLTRTAAAHYAQTGIYMNSVDTGWITEENPHPTRVRLRRGGFVPPLDEIDGAARVYDPILRGLSGEPVWGLFLKNYHPAPW